MCAYVCVCVCVSPRSLFVSSLFVSLLTCSFLGFAFWLVVYAFLFNNLV